MYLALKTTSDPGLAKQAFHTLTRVRLLTKFPHAGIVSRGRLMHTNLANGLHAVPFTDSTGWVLIEIPGDEDELERLFDIYEGTSYDWFSLTAFVLPLNVRDSDRMYCYEWCWLVMTGEEPNFRVTPEMLLELAHRLKQQHGVPDAADAR